MFIRVDRGCAHQLRPPLVAKSVDWRAPRRRPTAGGEHAVDDARRRTGCQGANSYCSPDLEDQSVEGAPTGALGWGNTGSNPRQDPRLITSQISKGAWWAARMIDALTVAQTWPRRRNRRPSSDAGSRSGGGEKEREMTTQYTYTITARVTVFDLSELLTFPSGPVMFHFSADLMITRLVHRS
jgi:hypothetical protein